MHILKIRRIIADGLKIPESMAFQLRQNCIAAVLGLAGELGEDAYLELYKSLEAIQREAERVCGMTLSVGVGPSVSPVCNLSQSYAKAKDALEYKFLMGCNKIFDSRDIRSVEEGRTFYFPTSIEEELQKHVRFGNKDGAVSCVMQLQEFFSEAGAEREYIKTTVSGIVLRLFQNLYEVGALTGESLVSQDEPIRAIQNFDDSTLLFDWLLDVIEGICEETESIMLCRHKKIVGDVERYIETNYMDEELNLNKIAKSVGVSPTYLSSIFKKGTRINISEYIQRVRMERAQDMLLFSDDLIIEISLKVGFSNQFYFSTCFKKYTGQTPNEFRNRRIRKQG